MQDAGRGRDESIRAERRSRFEAENDDSITDILDFIPSQEKLRPGKL
jgi:hypothetical protein